MITTLKKYEGHHIDNQIEQDHIISEYLGTFERKMLIFENYWTEEFFTNDLSVKPFFENIGNILVNNLPVQVAHRYFDSEKSLSNYVKIPDGLIWKDASVWGTSVFYIGSHGSKTGLDTTLGTISKDQLLDTFRGLGDLFPNILYFGSCSLFGQKEGEEFGRELSATSNCRAVLGYKSEHTGFLHSILTDLLFLSRFFGLKEDPFGRLADLYKSVLKDFPPANANDIGFTMFLNENYLKK
jgi:hypothetical protein